MSYGDPSVDRYRAATARMTPTGSIQRQRCTVCAVIKSLGQYPIDSGVCVKCKPQPAGWRRGTL